MSAVLPVVLCSTQIHILRLSSTFLHFINAPVVKKYFVYVKKKIFSYTKTNLEDHEFC